MDHLQVTSWPAGANNVAPRDRLPDGAVRECVNLDVLPGGRLALRAGERKALELNSGRGVLALGTKLLVADGSQLIELNTRTGTSRVLRQIIDRGRFVGAVLNQRLYFCTANEALEYDGETVRPWGVPDVELQPACLAVTNGGLQAGEYQVAQTYTDQWGREGGTDRPVVIRVADGQAIRVTVAAMPAGCSANIYVSSLNGETLYLQAQVAQAGNVLITRINDDTARCETVRQWAPPVGSAVWAHNGCLAIAVGNLVQITRPFRAHLVDRLRGFFQFPAPVNLLASIGSGLLVGADRLYALSAMETGEVSQSVVFESPAIAGTAVQLPDGRCAFMTPYGQALVGSEGVQLLSRASYLPADAQGCASGLLEHNGNQLLVSVLRSQRHIDHSMKSTDRYLGEVQQ